ncbi:MAG: universal stress protein [Bernardetiaceae bacterium]|nr:universal stress protein [Bernardetiaceae bacterium]
MMISLKNIMIALDFSAMDTTLIDYASDFTSFFGVEKVYFVHVQEDLVMPEEVKKELYGTDQPLDEFLAERMKAQVERVFADSKIARHYLVAEGKVLDTFVHWAKVKDVDLIVTGVKNASEGSGLIPKKLARKAAASVLFVPQKERFSFDKIMLGTDFSENSRHALETVAGWARERGQSVEVFCHHSISVPSGYSKTGKTYEQMLEVMKRHAQKSCSDFLAQSKIGDLNVRPLFSNSQHYSPSEQLLREAKANDINFVVVSSRGRSNFSALFLGSFAEELISLEIPMPMLILKERKQALGVWEALMRL